MIKPEFYGYKLATQANSTIDTLRMLRFVYNNSKTTEITGICMGELGEATRILAPVVGGHLTFAAVDDASQTAPGQLAIKPLLERYNYQLLNSRTAIYALLGDPIAHSIGHIFHNRVFKKTSRNAVYLKIQLRAAELEKFFCFARQLPFGGFSVTMPLKEKVLPYLDKLAKDAANIKAVNTIVISKKRYFGSNTDGVGALNAIETKAKVKNKNLIIIGAGGTARAIAYESLRKGGHVIIVNRTRSKAMNLAAELGCDGYGFDYLDDIGRNDRFNILVNSTSVGMKNEQLPINLNNILLPAGAVLDMVLSEKDTPVIEEAKKLGFDTLTGKLAFIMQGIQQQLTWFPK